MLFEQLDKVIRVLAAGYYPLYCEGYVFTDSYNLVKKSLCDCGVDML